MIYFWDLTNKCNLNCKYCYNIKIKHFKNASDSIDSINKIIENIKPDSHVHLLGGEPTLANNFDYILTKLNQNRNEISLVTNATNINDKLLELLKGNNVNYVIVSIDGFDSTSNRLLRNIRNTDKYYENIKKLNTYCYGTKIIVNTVISNYNYNEIRSLFSTYNKLKLTSVTFNRVSGNDKDYSLSNKQWIESIYKISEESLKYEHINIQINTTPFIIDYLNNKYNINMNKYVSICPIYENRDILYIRNDGKSFLCTDWEKLDKLFKEKNMEILSESLDKYRLKLLESKPIKNYKNCYCSSCIFSNRCKKCPLEDSSYEDINDCYELLSSWQNNFNIKLKHGTIKLNEGIKEEKVNGTYKIFDNEDGLIAHFKISILELIHRINQNKHINDSMVCLLFYLFYKGVLIYEIN